MAIYRIHPGIGIARLGNSPDELCITPEKPAALPIACDAKGNAMLSSDGQSELTVKTFKDDEGRIKRQAARFQIYVYDDESPEGRPLKIGDPVAGGGNAGTLVDVQWRVYLANKKASWYEFDQLDGEHGYDPTQHPRRNASITEPQARQRLIIDPGPRIVDRTDRRTARFDADSEIYAPTFPPPLQPKSIDTLGELITDDDGRLLVLGGYGNSGSFNFDQFGQPRIDTYANNDGWFDDTSDGPVMARLVMYSEEVTAQRFVDVEYPAWVVVGYPAYVPEILDMVTTNEVIEDLGIQQFAERTDLYGATGTFDDPQRIDPLDREALILWQAERLEWNPDYKPWFYRDIWPILYRPDQFTYLTSILGLSNYPHNQSKRGRFDPTKLSVPPMVDRKAVKRCEQRCIEQNLSGELFVNTLAPALLVLEKQTQSELGRAFAAAGKSDSRPAATAISGLLTDDVAGKLRDALAEFARQAHAEDAGGDFQQYLQTWRQGAEAKPSYAEAKERLEQQVQEILADLPAQRVARWDTEAGRTAARGEGPGVRGGVGGVLDQLGAQLRVITLEHLRKYHTGRLLDEARRKCVEANTYDPYRDYRTFLFDLLRQPGDENEFFARGRVNSRTHNLPLMPLLAGDNPISNDLPSKFLRLTDTQYYLLRQWAAGLFYNEDLEGWACPDPWQPYAGWVNRTGRDLDRGVLTNVLGGAFCPGGEIGWVQRNPTIYRVPYRIKADPLFYEFRQTAAEANNWVGSGAIPESAYVSYTQTSLSQDNNFDAGLQPGDLTKYMALPWQADFNECSTQSIDITYEGWNAIETDGDALMKREQKVWETLWWPAHRPLQAFEITSMSHGQPASYAWLDWSRGIPQTKAGDLKMTTDWWRLGFIIQNPFLPADVLPTELPPDQKYISVERYPSRDQPRDRSKEKK
ncbi:MAG TPA: LodA/GoxA family CTQ-dependent oxidase [Thermoanaerobaculia bacterium]